MYARLCPHHYGSTTYKPFNVSTNAQSNNYRILTTTNMTPGELPMYTFNYNRESTLLKCSYIRLGHYEDSESSLLAALYC